MNLTFKGFTRSYLCELTRHGTTSLRLNLQYVLTDSPSASEVLWCYAAASGRLPYLCRLAEGTRLGREYRIMADGLRAYDGWLGDYLLLVGWRYAKVWNAYLNARDPMGTLRAANPAIRMRVREVLEVRGISAYRAFGELGINRGDGYAWLRGDDYALSPMTALKMYVDLSGDPSARGHYERLLQYS